MKKTPGREQELPEPTQYAAVLIGIYGIGTQGGVNFDPREQIVMNFELHRRSGPSCDSYGEPFTVQKTVSYTTSGKKAVLRIFASELLNPDEDIPSVGFDPEVLLGLTCMVTTVNEPNKSGKTFPEIMSVTRRRLGSDNYYPIESQADQHTYDLEPHQPIPNYVPFFVKWKIQHSAEWIAVHGAPKDDAGAKTYKQSTNPATPPVAASPAKPPAPPATPPPVNPAGSKNGGKPRQPLSSPTTRNGSNDDEIPF